MVEKLIPKKDAVVKWHTQAGNITNNIKVKIDFTSPGISATNIMTWKFHEDEFSKVRYDMILGRDLLIELLID